MKKCKRYNDPGHAHELTFSCYKQLPFLKNEMYCTFIAEALISAKEKYEFHIWAYVFMPEHLHLLAWPAKDSYSISTFLRSIKQSTSRRVIEYLKKNSPHELKPLETGKKYPPYHFWTPGGGYDRNMVTKKAILNSIEYIHRNPVRRGLVENPEDWYWSSCMEWQEPGSGPIQVDRESLSLF